MCQKLLRKVLQDKLWTFNLIFLLIFSQFCWKDVVLASNLILKLTVTNETKYESQRDDFYQYYNLWKSLAGELNCPSDGYDGIPEQLGRYGFDIKRSPLENPKAKMKQLKTMNTDTLERFFNVIPKGSALVKIRGSHIYIAKHRPDTLTNLVNEFINDTLYTLIDYLPDMDIIFNTWDEPVVLPHHSSLDYYGSARPLYSESMESPYVLALLESEQCALSSMAVTNHRLNHYFFMRKRLKTHSNIPIPVFSFTSIKNCFADVTYPGWHYRSQNPFSEYEVGQFPWEKKKNILFWRGSKTGADSEDAELAALGLRSKFVRYAKETNRMIRELNANWLVPIDAGFTSFYFPNAPEEEAKFSRIHPKANFTAIEKQLEYKYIMMLDGWSFNERIYRSLSSGSLIFRAFVFHEWYEHLLSPWIHYVPVNLDLSDLNEKLIWAKEHDIEAKAIAEEARRLAQKYLNVKFHRCYLTRMLVEYASLLNVTV